MLITALMLFATATLVSWGGMVAIFNYFKSREDKKERTAKPAEASVQVQPAGESVQVQPAYDILLKAMKKAVTMRADGSVLVNILEVPPGIPGALRFLEEYAHQLAEARQKQQEEVQNEEL